MRGGEDAGRLKVVSWGLRFADAQTERDYRAWHLRTAVPFTRIGMIGSVVAWCAVATIVVLVQPPATAVPFVASSLGIMLPLLALGLASASSARLLRWMLPATMLANCAAGLLAVGLSYRLLDMPDSAMGGACIVAYFGFVIFRLRLGQALLAVSPYVVLNQVLVIESFTSGRLGVAAVGVYSGQPAIALATGALACAVLDRLSRGSYRQERVIEAQREEIERERARADVAERARQLSEALLRLVSAPAPTPLAPGDVVEDRYRLLRAIGSGGMGQVHEVERIDDGRRLALKVLTRATDTAALARFAREAQVAAELRHPNIVPTLDVGVTRGGTLFYVMELVTGSTLADQHARYGDARWALPILRQIADALAAMHERGIIHRDLKPGNVLLDGETAKVADFGLASAGMPVAAEAASKTKTAKPLTGAGAFMGTPAYMAPESAMGAHEVEPSADLFSLGVIAYQLLANRMPHAVPPVWARMAEQATPPVTPLATLRPDLPASLTASLDACLADAPEQRPGAAELEELLRGARLMRAS